MSPVIRNDGELPEPETTYQVMLHGQLVTVKRYAAVVPPPLLIQSPWPARKRKEPEEETEEDKEYARIRSLKPLDGRIRW